MKIKAVIFNHNQRQSAEELYAQLSNHFDLALFDSGCAPDQISPLSTHQFDNLFWTGCWNKVWELFPDFDAIWGIGGDCQLKSPPDQYKQSLASLYPFGTWSPGISGRSHEYMQPSVRQIFSVHYLEGIAMAISRQLWQLAGPLDPANYIGHAQDLICCFTARQNNLKNILDTRLELFHPESDGYDLSEAKALMFDCLQKRFGDDWCDVMDWWWERRLTFFSNSISQVRVVDGQKHYFNPFPVK